MRFEAYEKHLCNADTIGRIEKTMSMVFADTDIKTSEIKYLKDLANQEIKRIKKENKANGR